MYLYPKARDVIISVPFRWMPVLICVCQLGHQNTNKDREEEKKCALRQSAWGVKTLSCFVVFTRKLQHSKFMYNESRTTFYSMKKMLIDWTVSTISHLFLFFSHTHYYYFFFICWIDDKLSVCVNFSPAQHYVRSFGDAVSFYSFCSSIQISNFHSICQWQTLCSFHIARFHKYRIHCLTAHRWWRLWCVEITWFIYFFLLQNFSQQIFMYWLFIEFILRGCNNIWLIVSFTHFVPLTHTTIRNFFLFGFFSVGFVSKRKFGVLRCFCFFFVRSSLIPFLF